MRIYTGGGDEGETGLFGGGRVAKDHLRVEAYGAVDELNAAVGLARAAGLPEPLEALAARIQEELFVLGADLATPADSSARAERLVRLEDEAVEALEAAIDELDAELEPLSRFVLPGGGSPGAALHLARTVCRRAERRVVTLAREKKISASTVPYLNRLSDLLFVMARFANTKSGRPEELWEP